MERMEAETLILESLKEIGVLISDNDDVSQLGEAMTADWDSFVTFNLLLDLEQKTGVRFELSQIGRLNSVVAITDALAQEA